MKTSTFFGPCGDATIEKSAGLQQVTRIGVLLPSREKVAAEG
jgi:hypothetical protein